MDTNQLLQMMQQEEQMQNQQQMDPNMQDPSMQEQMMQEQMMQEQQNQNIEDPSLDKKLLEGMYFDNNKDLIKEQLLKEEKVKPYKLPRNAKEIFQKIKQDYTNCMSYNEIWHTKIDDYLSHYHCTNNLYTQTNENSSKIISRDIKKYIEWFHSSLLDSFTSTQDIIKVNPKNAMSVDSARNAEAILNMQFCRQNNRYDFISKALKVLCIEGTCIVKTGWDFQLGERDIVYYEEEPDISNDLLEEGLIGGIQLDKNIINTMIQDGSIPMKQTKKSERVEIPIVNKPTAKVVNNKDIFLDPTCNGDIDNMQFIIHRYDIDYTTLISNTDKYDKSAIESAFNKMLDRENQNDRFDRYDISKKTLDFKFTDKSRKKVTMYEYWGNYDLDKDGIAEPIVCCWIEDTVIKLDKNYYPDNKPPFVITPLIPIPFQLFGEGLGENLKEIQQLNTALYRALINNTARSSYNQVFYSKNAISPDEIANLEKGFDVGVNAQDVRNAVMQGSFPQIPNSVFNLLQILEKDANAITGIITQPTMNTNIIGENAGTRGQQIDSGNMRKLMIVKNISESMIKPILRKWLAYDSELLEDEIIIQNTGNNNFEIVKRDDLYGEVDLELAISTNEDNSAKARELAFLLQTLGPTLPPEITQSITVKISDLLGMYDLSQNIINYKPQPDPMQQELAQAQLELLKAQISELQTKAGRNQVDATLRQAKSMVEEAKAKSISEDIDAKQLNYYQKENRFDANQQAALRQQEIDYKNKDLDYKIAKDQLANLKQALFMNKNEKRNMPNKKHKKHLNKYEKNNNLDNTEELENMNNDNFDKEF